MIINNNNNYNKIKNKLKRTGNKALQTSRSWSNGDTTSGVKISWRFASNNISLIWL